MRICLSAPNTLGYPDGGHIWVFINWALGLRSLGHDVVWLDVVNPDDSPELVDSLVRTLCERLKPFALDTHVVLCTAEGAPYQHALTRTLDEAIACHAIINLRYNLPSRVLRAFRRSALIDIDPGQFQFSVQLGTYDPGEHDVYFTVGEWPTFIDVTPPQFTTLGKTWHTIPPPVALDEWPVTHAAPDAAMTTVSAWYMKDQWLEDDAGQWYDNSKRAAFMPYLDVAGASTLPMELCIQLNGYQPEIDLLQSHHWRLKTGTDVSHPQAYRQYIQQSIGEFSCAKPAYVKLHTGWLSDRTACYLASGKPVVIQRTGESRFLPDQLGVLRFTSPDQAIKNLRHVHDDYATHAVAARAIAEQHLDAKKVLKSVLEKLCV